MKFLAGLAATIAGAFQRFLAPVLRAIFGQIKWTPPDWLPRVAARLRLWGTRGIDWLNARRAANPKGFWLTTAAILAVIIGGYAGWQWYEHLPEPYYLQVSVSRPGPTPLEPNAIPDTVDLQFSGSAAKLGAIGKNVTSGITVTPPLEGVWRWVSDSQLVFTPRNDWPISQDYTITLDRKLFPSHILLKDYSYSFRSPDFGAAIVDEEFYEDPTDPKIKQVVATVQFTHPVDKADFEKRISFRMRVEPVKNFDSSDAKSFGFKVTYNATAGKAFIHSDPFGIPSDEGEMLLSIAKGVRSVLGGPGTDEALERTVNIPGIESYFRIESVNANEVANDRDEMERIGTITASAPMRQSDLAKNISVFLLPKDKPAIGDEKLVKDYNWSDPLEVVPGVMKLATPVAVEWIPAEREFFNTQSFKFTADTGRFLLVTVHRGLKSFGDYPLAKDYSQIIAANAFPPAVKIISEGSVLSLSGEKKISILTRNVPAIQIEVSRLLPGSVSHLVSQTEGTFSDPTFWRQYGNSTFGFDDLSEVISQVRELPAEPSGKNQYTVFDFGPLQSSGALPHGLFWLKIQAWDPVNKVPLGSPAPAVQSRPMAGRRYRRRGQPWVQQSQPVQQDSAADERLILLSDLGLVVKDSADGSHDVFVQSIHTGAPLADVAIDMLGKNGLPIFSRKTDADGRATFPTFKDFTREKTPTVYVAQSDGDFSFLPYQRSDRQLNLSRFDTGGLYTQGDSGTLQAYLFSDRGIYRPGDAIHIGVVVKQMDWKPLPEGLPLEMVETDPRGVAIRSQTIKFSSTGLEDFSTATEPDSPTGSYDFSLYIMRDETQQALLGSTTVRVEEFQPDRMTIKADLSKPASAGWISPDALSATVKLRTLFGTAAVGRKVKGSFKLTPSGAEFDKYPNYLFVDPYDTQKSYDEDLGEVATDADGSAKFDFKLERFEKGLYRLRFIAEGFEPEGGRSVVTDSTAIVSPAPYLVAYKPDGDLNYIDKDSVRAVHLIAIGPKLDKVPVDGLTTELIEFRYVSVLTQQENGTLAYQSVRKEISTAKTALAIPAAGLTTNLPTTQAGSFALVIRDSSGVELNRISFEVVGHANVARSLEREAELKIKLSKPEYAPGEDAEIEIQAPYVGGGLITVERDHIYNAQWFKTTTTESVQKIKIPEELEGNGYITVTFLRSLDSKEIFTSPLSYGSVPFTVSRARHIQGVTINTPKLVRPGDSLNIGYQTAGPAKLVLIAVDEGILQVARYHTPDPLSYFFRKRALEVTTSQILDLVLPELHLLNEASAPGGDEEGLMARSHNPFKRKGQKPVAFWSGIIESDGKPGHVEIPIPDYFNGTIRVMAIAVSDGAVGVAENKVVSQGYFVLQPQAPYFATPGDQFEVTTLVANNLASAPNNSKVKVEINTTDALQVIGDKSIEVPISPGTDTTVRFRVLAKPILGDATLTFTASAAGKHADYTLDMSVRPSSPYVTTVTSGYVKKSLLRSVKADLPLHRQMYPQMRRIEVSASSFPLGFANGLIHYLETYPYGCTEQLVSQAFPAVVLGSRPELGMSSDKSAKSIAHAIATLEARQNADGAFGLWAAGGDVVPFVNVYAAHFLLEAREHGFEVPPTLMASALNSLRTMITSPGNDLESYRADAYALYVLARTGVVVTDQANALRASMDQNAANVWPSDIAALYLASTYQLLKMDREASEIIGRAPKMAPADSEFDAYCDSLVYSATYLYLTSKHFPDRAKKIGPDQILAIADAIKDNRQNTISSAYALLALDAYAQTASSLSHSLITFTALMPDKKSRPLDVQNAQFAHAEVPADAKSVHVEGDTDFALFYQLTEAGFDLAPPITEIKNQIEVFREFDNEKGEPVTSSPVESKVDVKMSLRAIDSPVSNVAIVDMIPGGFEIDISPEGLGNRTSGPTDATTWHPDFIDVREDRVVFYGTVGTDAQTFSYRLKPTNRGTFVVPPLYAEGMYNRTVQARSVGGKFVIGDPAESKSP
ncbi:alpha-2-macroglobulin [Candidatus Binatus sp.]|uniref:alpha-2-macroglobulin n=1 Tax=Candidatus Binatus sp. TaxID=2811406 RepID=UPI003CC6A3EC